MTKNLLFIASLSFLPAASVSAQNAGKSKTVVVENKKITTTRTTCTEPQSNVDFFDFFKHLKAHNGFDSEKLREAEMSAASGCFTSKQVGITLSAFTYEDARVAFAKFAYKYVYDKAAFEIVKDGFKKESSWPEVEEYIKHH